MKTPIVFIFLLSHALSAPAPKPAPGCIDACVNQQIANLQNSNYFDHNRPGNWSEHNQYITDGGRGRIHEEHGQYVDGSKQIRFFKKNYSSSYNSDDVGGLSTNIGRLGSYGTSGSSNVDAFETMGHSLQAARNIQAQQMQHLSATQNSAIEEMRRSMESSRNSFGHSSVNERLEDFGQHGETYSPDRPGNWSKVDSYKTDNGHGQVFVEQGQLVTGPKKIKYYKKNYTSSYVTGNMPAHDVPTLGMEDIQREIQNLQRQLESSTVGGLAPAGSVHHGSHVGRTDDLHVAESAHYQQSYGQQSATYGVNEHNKNNNMYQQSVTDDKRNSARYESDTTAGPEQGPGYLTSNQNVRSQYSAEKLYVIPPNTPQQQSYENIHTSESYNRVRNPNLARVPLQTSHRYEDIQREVTPGYRTLNGESTHERSQSSVHHGYSSASTEEQQAEYHQRTQPRYDQPGHIREYEKHNDHSRIRETFVPQYEMNSHNQQLTHQSVVSQQPVHHHQSYSQQSSYYNQGRNTYVGQSNGEYFDPAYRTRTDKLVNGVIDMNNIDHSDCVSEGGQYSLHRHHRRYRRGAMYGRGHIFLGQGEDMTRQERFTNDDFNDNQQFANNDQVVMTGGGKFRLRQHFHGHHNHHFMVPPPPFPHDAHSELAALHKAGHHHGYGHVMHHHSSGKFVYGQQTEDFKQQATYGDDSYTIGNLGHPTGNIGHAHLGSHLHHTGHLGLGQNPGGLPQTSFAGNLYHSGQLELGQQTEDLSHITAGGNLPYHGKLEIQETEDLSQVTIGGNSHHNGKLEFGQQTEDLSQATVGDNLQHNRQVNFGREREDLSQANIGSNLHHNGKLEFEQNLEDLAQEVFGSNLHHDGKLELGQQTEDLSQINVGGSVHQNGRLEFGQQTEDLSQATINSNLYNNGKLEMGQQTEDLSQATINSNLYNNGKLELGQQTEDLSQINVGGSVHQNGRLEFGQQTEDLSQVNVGDSVHQNGRLEFGQQTEDLSQATINSNLHHNGNLELGQQTEDLSQVNLDGDSYHNGNFEFGQQTEDLSQANIGANLHHSGKLELGQGTTGSSHVTTASNSYHNGKLDFGQQTEDLSHVTIGGDLHHSGKLELGQQTEDLSQVTIGGNSHLNGKLDFGQQTEDLSQVTISGDLHHNGKLELGQQTEDLSRVTIGGNTHHNGRLEFGQQTEDLSQMTNSGNLQHSGKLEFGQEVEDMDQGSTALYQQTTSSNHVQHNNIWQFGQDNKLGVTQDTLGGLELESQSQHNMDLSQQAEKWIHPTNFNDHSEHNGKFSLEHVSKVQGNKYYSENPNGPFGLEHQDQTTQQIRPDDLSQLSSLPVNNQFGNFYHQSKEDNTQSTTAHLEFGHLELENNKIPSQHSEKPIAPELNLYEEDHKIQPKEPVGLSQTAPEKIKIPKETPETWKTDRMDIMNQYSEDLNQQIRKFEDLSHIPLTMPEKFPPQEHKHLEVDNSNKGFDSTVETFQPSTEQTSQGQHHVSGNLDYEKQQLHTTPPWKIVTPTKHVKPCFKYPAIIPGTKSSRRRRPIQVPCPDEETTVHPDADILPIITTPSENDVNVHHRLERHEHRGDMPVTSFDDTSIPAVVTSPPSNFQHEDNQQHTVEESGNSQKPREMHGQRPRPDWPPKINSFNMKKNYNNFMGDLTNSENQHTEQSADFSQQQQTNSLPNQYTYEGHVTGQASWEQNSRQHGTGFNFAQSTTGNVENSRMTQHSSVNANHGYGQTSQGPNHRLTDFYTPPEGTEYKQTATNNDATLGKLELGSQQNIAPQNTENEGHVDVHFQPRILEAYGGRGRYDKDHGENIFHEAKLNPTATLAPLTDGVDPWDVHEKPVDGVIPLRPSTNWETYETTPSTEQTTEQPRSFWSRVGHKISNTYDKAKEKARGIFGR